MKDRGVLHPQLARVLASMGHGDLLGVADAGLPIPTHVERVDLGFAPGQPSFAAVLDAVCSELRVEAAVLAAEARDVSPGLADLVASRLPGVHVAWVPHAELKRRAGGARAVVRTGELTPYANVLLVSGVDFDDAGRLPKPTGTGSDAGPVRPAGPRGPRAGCR